MEEVANDNTSPKTSRELLDIIGTKAEKKDLAVYSLLQDKTQRKPTFKMPPSSKLQLVKQFLPQLQLDNQRIFKEIETFPVNKSKFDIEDVENTDGPLIEMDLLPYEEPDSDSESCSSDSTETSIKIPGLSDIKSDLVQEINQNED